MTTLTGKPDMKLKGTTSHPTFGLALFGAVAQTSVLLYNWYTNTTAKACISNPYDCLVNYKDADPWGRMLIFTMTLCSILWVISVINQTEAGGSDPSIVDRLWSILPVVYAWHMFLSSAETANMTNNPRLCVMVILISAWGMRLTYNFYIKGGFSGGEDYRWELIRKWFPGWQYEVFNFFFICFYQQLVILGFTAPIVTAFQSSAEWQTLDTIATVLFLTLLVGEATADRQQFVFQTEKYARKNARKPLGKYSKGFIDTGLWGISRHPNYFCEVSMWWCIYLFSVSATGGNWHNWSMFGCVFLTLLFVPPNGSIDCTESISSKKYSAYADYQKRVSRFFPWFPSSTD